MPNFGVWETVVIFALILIPCGMAIALSPPVIRAALTEIRKAWDASAPRPKARDNHRDRD